MSVKEKMDILREGLVKKLDGQIDMLDGSGGTVFVEIDPCSLQLTVGLIISAFQGKAGADVAQIDRSHAFLS